MNIGCFLGTINTSIIGYADDIIILAPTLSSLQYLLDEFSATIRNLCIQINTKKKVFI